HLDHKASEHDRDFKRAARDREREARALQAQVDSLSQENDDLRDCIRGLENRLTARSLNVARTMNFLNRHGTRVDGSWPRLKALLEHAKDSKMPPSGWKTQILVNAIDDFGAQFGPYTFEDEGSPDDGDSKENDRSGNRDGSKDKPLDLSHDSSGPQQTPKKPKASGKSRSWGTVQLRPSAYTPNDHDALDATKQPLRTVTQVRESLKDLPVVWSKQRSDLQQVMLCGLDFQDALDLASGDNEVHTRITSRALTQMLVRMMYWGKLDQTPWTKRSSSRRTRWPNLKKVRLEDEAEIQMALYEDVSSEEDSERDAEFQDGSPSGKSQSSSGRRTPPPRGAKRKRDSESGASGKSSGGSDSGEPEHKRSRPSQERKQSALARKKSSKFRVVVSSLGVTMGC
ncbi:hypothetical protein PPTG_20316, partial [Phytophthora nicotianae INRA-310]